MHPLPQLSATSSKSAVLAQPQANLKPSFEKSSVKYSVSTSEHSELSRKEAEEKLPAPTFDYAKAHGLIYSPKFWFHKLREALPGTFPRSLTPKDPPASNV
jgi:hypothetical protein